MISPARNRGKGAGRVEAPDRVITRASAFSTSNLPEQLRTKIAISDEGCWIWTAARSHGYGVVTIDRRLVKAHRSVYQALVGQIPEGLTIDHLCRERACVNPEHLEPVTHRENILRGEGVAAKNAAKTHCPYGHEYDEKNTRRTGGRRVCRECSRLTAVNRRAVKAGRVEKVTQKLTPVAAFETSAEAPCAGDTSASALYNTYVKVTCVNGHNYLPDNLGINTRGHRYCKTCQRESARRHQLRKAV